MNEIKTRYVPPTPQVTVAWFGASIMQHLEGYNASMTTQACLPDIGASVIVEQWVTRGYVHRLHTTWQTRSPDLRLEFRNYGEGGATSRDILATLRRHAGEDVTVSVLGCGINDV